MRLFNQMDWKLLRKQKNHLVRLTGSSKLTPAQLDALEGMLALVDAVQDTAVDELGFSEKKVFG